MWRLMERRWRRAGSAARNTGRSAWLHAIHPRRGRVKPVRPGASGFVLAFQMGGLGDLVLTLPAFDDLARAHPAARIVAVVRSGFASIVMARESIGTVMELKERQDAPSLASRLSIFGAALAVDFSSAEGFLAPRATALAGIPARVGLTGAGREVFLTHAVRRAACGPAQPETISRVVAAAGGAPSGRRPALEVTADAAREAELMLVSLGASADALRLAVHPGAGHPSRRWPTERFAAAARGILAKRGGRAVILIGAGEEDLARRIKMDLKRDGIVVPPGDLRSFASVLSRCDLLLANDSGPLHLAGALDVPTVSLWGPTDPRRRSPQGLHQEVLRREDVPCSPCTRSRCAPHDCLLRLDPEEVTSRALDSIDRAVPPARAARADEERRPGPSVLRRRDEAREAAYGEGELVGTR